MAAICSKTSVGFIPLIDGSGIYNGTNLPSEAHLIAGQVCATELKLRPKNVFISVGMSNTRMEFELFQAIEALTLDKAPNLIIVNGAQDGHTAARWTGPIAREESGDNPYDIIDYNIGAAGAEPNDVGVVWIKLTEKAEFSLSIWHQKLLASLRLIVDAIIIRYPNVKMIYCSSRIYGGYEPLNSRGGSLNSEPYAYELGLVIKDFVLEKIGTSPWIGWGPYLWADGMIPRSDGLIWECSDMSQIDGVHPSPNGCFKVANILSDFLRNDLTSQVWFNE